MMCLRLISTHQAAVLSAFSSSPPPTKAPFPPLPSPLPTPQVAESGIESSVRGVKKVGTGVKKVGDQTLHLLEDVGGENG